MVLFGGFFRALFSFRPPVLRVRSEQGEQVLSNAVAVVVGNAPFAGGGLMRIGPGASMTDGVLELTLIEAVGRWALALQFFARCAAPMFVTGKSGSFEGIGWRCPQIRRNRLRWTANSLELARCVSR